MRLFSLLLLSLLLVCGCAATQETNPTQKDYKFKYISNSETEDKRIEKIKEYIDKKKPDFWRNLTDNEKLIWLDYALYSADKYGYGYGEKLYSYINFTQKLGAAFMDDEDVEENIRKFLRDDRFSDFVRLRDGFRYLVKKGVEDRLPNGVDIEKILKISLKEPTYKKKKRGKVKPFITISANNSSESDVQIESVYLDGSGGGSVTGSLGCSANHNWGSGSESLYSVPPTEYIDIKWYSWADKSNYKARVELPGEKVMNNLYFFPPWYDPELDSRPDSTIIIDIRPNNTVWVKLAKGEYVKAQDDIMILGEGVGKKTDEVVTKYKSFIEGEHYRLDCLEQAKKAMENGTYTGPVELFDDWYPGAPQNKE
ncbi:hypothetical protein [Kangiella sp.]|uniref:hypothetical protein n=1 Tax=Kangiella sp. TaxID=1920245 RepID=UPI0019CBE703|nr:hypothetical protein [Kangiella sp.]MBD3654751.1 hypothetical protein [Kangiella sp.]